jgi:hypothetical protein
MKRIRNKKVHERLKEFAKVALKFLETNFRREYPKLIPTQEYEFRNGALFRTVYKLHPDYFSFVRRYNRELELLKEVDGCIQVMLEDGILKEPKLVDSKNKLIEHPSKEQIRPIFVGELISFLERLIERTEGFEFVEKKFNELYMDYENFWYSKKLEFMGLVPLFNFECDVERIHLNNVELSRLTDEEKSRLSKGWGMFSPLSPMELSKAKYKLAIPYNIEKGQPISTEEVKEKADKILNALRLFKSGDVHYNTIYSFPRTFNPHFGTFSTTSHLKPVVPHFGKTYRLDDTEIDRFTAFFKEYEKIVSVGGYKNLDIAVRKFNDSYHRVVPEDKVIDYVIAFESTLLFGMDQELRYRFSVRAAMLLEKDPAKRKYISNIMKRLYDIRSSIVHHGEKIPPKISIMGNEYTSEEFISIAEDLLRRSMKEYGRRMLEGRSINEINKKLDEVVFEIDEG